MQFLIDNQPAWQQQQPCFNNITIPPFQQEASASWKFIHSNMIRVLKLQHQQNAQKNRHYLSDIYKINQQCNKKLKTSRSPRNYQFFLTQSQRENKFNLARSHSQSIQSFRRRLQSSFFRNTRFQGPFKSVQNSVLLETNTKKQHPSKSKYQLNYKNCNQYSARLYANSIIKNCKQESKRIKKEQIGHLQSQKPKQIFEISPLKLNFKSNSSQKDHFSLETLQPNKKLIPQRSSSNVQFKFNDLQCRQNKPVLKIKRQNNCPYLQQNSNMHTFQNKIVSNDTKCLIFPILNKDFNVRGKVLSDKKQIWVNPITQKHSLKLGLKHLKKSVSCCQNSNNQNQKLQIYLKFHSIPINGINQKIQKIRLQNKKNKNLGKKNQLSQSGGSVCMKQSMIMSNVGRQMFNSYSVQKQNQISTSIKEQRTISKELKSQKKPIQRRLEKFNPIKNGKAKLKIERK